MQKSEQRLRKLLLSAISLGLEFKFGLEGLQLLSEIRALDNINRLEAIYNAILTAKTLEDLRQLC